MQIEYFGANCVILSTKKVRLVFDDNLKELGLKSVTKTDDIAVFTSLEHSDTTASFVIDTPGEYEIRDISVKGIGAQLHVDESGKKGSIYQIMIDGIRICVVGNISDNLSEGQLEELGTVDVLIVPTGGSGFTLDPVGAKKIIKSISPKVFIPVHYADKSIKYEVPQVDLNTVIKEMTIESTEEIESYKLKSRDAIDENHKTVILKRK
ncbi:MAG: MBL fold metallo-hydrolase [Patescibacteria group bacterium]